jgi:hypothetical protein
MGVMKALRSMLHSSLVPYSLALCKKILLQIDGPSKLDLIPSSQDRCICDVIQCSLDIIGSLELFSHGGISMGETEIPILPKLLLLGKRNQAVVDRRKANWHKDFQHRFLARREFLAWVLAPKSGDVL